MMKALWMQHEKKQVEKKKREPVIPFPTPRTEEKGSTKDRHHPTSCPSGEKKKQCCRLKTGVGGKRGQVVSPFCAAGKAPGKKNSPLKVSVLGPSKHPKIGENDLEPTSEKKVIS